MSDFYDATGAPATNAFGFSGTIRQEFAAISTAFAKLPALTSNANALLQINPSGTAVLAVPIATAMSAYLTSTLAASTYLTSTLAAATYVAKAGDTMTGALNISSTGAVGSWNAATLANSYIQIKAAGAVIGYIGSNEGVTGLSGGVGLRSETYLSLAAGGVTERMRIDAAGNVGIGAPAPAGTRLQVQNANGTGSAALVVQGGTTAGDRGIDVRGGTPAGGFSMILRNAAGTNLATVAGDGSWNITPTTSGQIVIDATGNVGIGSAPTAFGAGTNNVTINSSGNPILDFNVGGTRTATVQALSTEFRVGSNTAIPFTFYSSGAERMRLDASGNLCVGNTSSIFTSAGRGVVEINGSASSMMALKVAGSPAVYLYHDGTNATIQATVGALIVQTGGTTERLRIDASGLVGINRVPTTYQFDSRCDTTGSKQFRFGGAGLTSLFGYSDASGSGITNSDPQGSGSLVYLSGTEVQSFSSGVLKLRVNSAGLFDGAGLELGYRDAPRTTSIVSVAAQRGKIVAYTVGVTLTGSDGWLASHIFSIYNDSAAAFVITQGTATTLRLAGTTITGNRTLAPRGMCTVWWNSSSEAVLSGAGLS